MSAYSKHAWVAFGLSLAAAGTAYAAIPDANGVIRGCYNVLTGSARIVDGNSCGLLEKAISWQQTGPRGPAGVPGAQGPVGPQGPAGSNNVVLGHGGFNLKTPLPSSPPVIRYLDDQTFTAPSDGFCSLTVSALQLEYTGPTSFTPLYRIDGGSDQTTNQLGIMVPNKRDSGSDFDSNAAGITMGNFDVQAGHNYTVGLVLSADSVPITVQRGINFTFAWMCQYES